MFISRFIQASYFKKYLAENAVNTISEPLDFKIFFGGMPPNPPTNSRLRRSFSAPLPPLRNTLRRPWIVIVFMSALKTSDIFMKSFEKRINHFC